MRTACLFALFALAPAVGLGYELDGRIEPAGLYSVFLHGMTEPFARSILSEPDGHFRFYKIRGGTCTIAVTTAARGEVRQTVEVGPATVNAKGIVQLVMRIDRGTLESDGVRRQGATVTATVLSIPDRALEEYRQAQRCLVRSDSACAVDHLARAVAITPQFAVAWNEIGTLAYRERRYQDAEKNFRRSLEADPGLFEPLVNLGGVLLNLGRPLEALNYNRRSVERRQNDALANSQLGMSYFLLKDPDQAEKYLIAAIRLDPAHFSHPQRTLAEVYIQRGDRASAIRALREFLEHHPDSPEAAEVRREIADTGP